MPILIHVFIYCLMLVTSASAAQQGANRELFLEPDTAKKEIVIGRNALEIRKSEYRAKQGRFGIFRVNMDLLEEIGGEFTISLFGDPPITVTSFGVHRNPETAFIVGTWTGEIRDPNGNTTYPIELGITTWAEDKDGNYGFPTPYQITVDEESNSRVSVRLAGTMPDRKVVYSVAGRIYVPFQKALFFVLPLEDNPDFSTIYEPDPEKSPQRSDIE